MNTRIARSFDRLISDPVQHWWKSVRGRQPRWETDFAHRHGRELKKALSERPVLPDEARKKVLCYSMIPWSQGGVEHILSTALRLRGHDVTSSVCGGRLPECELHFFDFDRPPCWKCNKSALRYTDAFQINPISSTSLLDENDVHEAAEITKGLSESELATLWTDGLPVGSISRFHLNVFYQTFLVDLDEQQVEQLRQFCVTSILLTRHASRLIDRVKPDIGMVANGKAFTYRHFFLTARRKGIPVVTWEEHAFDNTLKFVFNHNCFAGEIHLDSAWEHEQHRELDKDQVEQLDRYFQHWKHGENTPFAYHHNANRQSDVIYDQLNIPRGASIVCCFPNMVRDTAAFDRDVAFDSLIDWILETVQFAKSRPDQHFVIRAHPAEQCLPEKYGKYNRFFVCDEVRRHFPELPANVHLLEGDTEIDTYTLINESDVVLAYTSTVGIECALNGRLACIIGDVHYRGKGFTLDIQSPQQLWDFLGQGPPYQREISESQVQRAQRYAYLWRFRHPVVMPFFDTDSLSFKIPSVAELQPGGNTVIEQLCQHLLGGTPFVDITPVTPEHAIPLGVPAA